MNRIVQFLALVQLRVPGVDAWKEGYDFAHYLELTGLANEGENPLECLRFRCATVHEMGYSEDFSSMSENGLKSEVKTGKWCALVSSSIVMSAFHIVHFNYTVKDSAPQLQWLPHRFYIKIFYLEGS